MLAISQTKAMCYKNCSFLTYLSLRSLLISCSTDALTKKQSKIHCPYHLWAYAWQLGSCLLFIESFSVLITVSHRDKTHCDTQKREQETQLDAQTNLNGRWDFPSLIWGCKIYRQRMKIRLPVMTVTHWFARLQRNAPQGHKSLVAKHCIHGMIKG